MLTPYMEIRMILVLYFSYQCSLYDQILLSWTPQYHLEWGNFYIYYMYTHRASKLYISIHVWSSRKWNHTTTLYLKWLVQQNFNASWNKPKFRTIKSYKVSTSWFDYALKGSCLPGTPHMSRIFIYQRQLHQSLTCYIIFTWTNPLTFQT